MTLRSLKVGGLVPMTTVDYPGCLSAVIFCQGCPLRCRYCHNSDLLPREAETVIPWREILDFLKRRQGLLDAVVFSGGEPTQQRALPDAIAEVSAMGFKIGLHTAGIYPKRLQAILPSLDWVGLDIKALPEKYESLTGMPGSGDLAWQSAQILLESGIPYELRTTLHPALTSHNEKARIEEAIATFGESQHVWQVCRTDHCLDPNLRSS
ncbi:MAG: anaerobic ribonucleoside-triphosphate reductase activating protein [Candidatus Thiodiazotropha sp. (ex Monitilora ramsayi)]|nr:anaerobic ribonucleoside-triphosphate reductase activating protein [Candidatus Thiodiazotropha sp. (ex Monitilora ramsayi)]